MTLQNPTNTSRVQKMVDILDLIEKSAISNKASEEDLKALLQPLLDRLYGDSTPTAAEKTPASPEAPQKAPKPGTHAAFNSIRHAAETADLSDLTVAMAIYMDRIHEHLGSKK